MKCKNCEQDFGPNFKEQKFCIFCLEDRIKKQGSNSSRKRMIRNREFIQNYKRDKKCEICGYNKYPEILVFHHKNEEKKINGINILMKTLKNIDIIKNEIENCILICPNCHNELHLLEKNNKK